MPEDDKGRRGPTPLCADSSTFASKTSSNQFELTGRFFRRLRRLQNDKLEVGVNGSVRDRNDQYARKSRQRGSTPYLREPRSHRKIARPESLSDS